MKIEELLQQTQEQVRELNKNGRRIKYPQSLKDSIIELSNGMNASAIARAINVSSTFICRIIRLAKKEGSPFIKSTGIKKSVQNRSISKIGAEDKNLHFFEITDQLKSIMKDDNENTQLPQSPIMRFSTSTGTIIEIFS